MAKRKKAKAVPVYERCCQLCGLSMSAVTLDELNQNLIDHCEKKHADRKALVFDNHGRTWDAQYDMCLKSLHNMTAQRDQVLKERDAVAAELRMLAAKLNAIIMILEKKA